MPPVSLATVAFESAIASSSDVPSPSKSELMTNTSKLLMNDRMSARNPGKKTCFSRCSSLICRSSAGRKLAFAENHEPRVGYVAHDERCGVDEVLVSLLLRQRRDGADDGRVRRQPELRVDVRRRLRLHAMEIDAFVNGDDAVGVDAVADEHLVDGIRRGDEAIDLVILPARERVPLQVERDAARRDEARAFAARHERQRERRQRDGMRIVRMNDVGLQVLDDARQLPAGVEIDFGARREANEIVPFRRASGELAFGMRDEHGPVAPLAQAEHGEQHLALSASPGSRRVDVN